MLGSIVSDTGIDVLRLGMLKLFFFTVFSSPLTSPELLGTLNSGSSMLRDNLNLISDGFEQTISPFISSMVHGSSLLLDGLESLSLPLLFLGLSLLRIVFSDGLVQLP